MELYRIEPGRMRTNLLRRLLPGGCAPLVHDITPAIQAIVNFATITARFRADFALKLTCPRALWVVAPSGAADSTLSGLASIVGRGDAFIPKGGAA